MIEYPCLITFGKEKVTDNADIKSDKNGLTF